MIKVGRITAALLLVSVGVLLLLDQFLHTNYITLLLSWWPLVLISWGLEVIWFSLIKSGRKWKLDVIGMFAAVFISAFVFTAAQPNMFIDWLRSVQFDFSMMKQMVLLDGVQYERPLVTEQMTSDISALNISHSQGDIYVKSGNVQQLELTSLVTVYDKSKDSGQQLADQIELRVVKNAESNQWTVKAEGLDRLLKQNEKIRVDIQVIVPAHLSVPIDIKVSDGDINIQELHGDVKAQTSKGDIKGTDVKGSTKLETYDGDIEMKRVQGNGVFTTSNGDISASEITGLVQMSTKSGDLTLHEANSEVTMESLNGDIDCDSTIMAGNWNVSALAGDVAIQLPDDINARVHARNSFGEITSTFPLEIGEYTMNGVLGTGLYELNVDANGDITFHSRS
ncbi:DUF4097 family beta strand repeat-containing protein [Paenibacillus marinisediminis]